MIAVVLGAGRVLVGLALLLAPRRAGGAWIGSVAGAAAVPVVVRALGARDAAIGGGLILAATIEDPVRLWLLAGAFSDLVDMLATYGAGNRLDARSRAGTVAVAGASAVVGVVLALAVSA